MLLGGINGWWSEQAEVIETVGERELELRG